MKKLLILFLLTTIATNILGMGKHQTLYYQMQFGTSNPPRQPKIEFQQMGIVKFIKHFETQLKIKINQIEKLAEANIMFISSDFEYYSNPENKYETIAWLDLLFGQLGYYLEKDNIKQLEFVDTYTLKNSIFKQPQKTN